MTTGRLWALCALLAALCSAAAGKGSPEQDRDILVRFRDSISNWAAVKAEGHLEGWDDATPTYLWSGVILDFHQRVRVINLECWDFMRCLPSDMPLFEDFAKLEYLEELHLSGNRLHGDLPDAWAAPGAFPRLQQLTLSAAQLNGTLPASWGRSGAWPTLQKLRMDRNDLQGDLPPAWGSAGAFPALEQLVIEDNRLNGSLPANWGQRPAFPSLSLLALSGSGVRGQLPVSWGAEGGWGALTELSLARNGLEGPLPDDWASPDRFPKLVKIELRNNSLSGPLPSAWGCKDCFKSLQELNVPNNRLSGALPDTWGALGVLRTVDATNNSLSGELPAAWAQQGALTQLSTLILTSNQLGGSLPAKWGNPEALPALAWLDVSRNNLTGSLPDVWGAPNSFPRLRVLHMERNSLSGPLPTHWAFNSTMQQLFSWSLAHNNFSGSLPEAWGSEENSLAALFTLDLGFNNLSGPLPKTWGTRRYALASLASLVIAGNNFTGEIPPNWGLLQDLHYLVLAPGNPTVCRVLPYVGQYVTCYAEGGSLCEEPVQLRSNCSSDLPGWVPYTPPRPGSGGLTGLQIGLIVAGVCLLAACTALAAVLVLRWREQRRWQTLKGLDAELALRDGKDPIAGLVAAAAARKRAGHSALAQKLLKECAIDQADIMFCRGTDGNLVQLGAGAYGQVYKAFLHGLHPVAVKVFQTQDDMPAEDFWREISILRTCRHDNIVQFKGTCVDGDTTMMVTELMDTDLYRALQCRRVSWYKHGLDIAIDVARALHFLHTRNIIHFDCKSPNILLSTTNQAKLADVGWAQILYHSYITGDGGTFNWAAPEQLIGLQCTAKADVYSFGLVLWEICTREVPVRGQIRDIRIPAEAPQLVADLVRGCLDVDPAKRPGMEDIIAALEAERACSSSGSGSGSGPSGSGTRYLSGPSSTTSPGSSLAGQLAGFTGPSQTGSDTSAFLRGSGTSSDGGLGSSSGAPSNASSLRGGPDGSIGASVWGADSTPPGGSQAGDSSATGSLRSLPRGRDGSQASGPRYHNAGYEGMSVGAALGGSGPSAGSSGWYGGSSSSQGGTSDHGGLFAGSAWAAGRPAAVASGATSAADNNGFSAGASIAHSDGPSWGAAGSNGGSNGGSGGGSSGDPAPYHAAAGIAPAAAADNVFANSAWARGLHPAAPAAQALQPAQPAQPFAGSPWWQGSSSGGGSVGEASGGLGSIDTFAFGSLGGPTLSGFSTDVGGASLGGPDSHPGSQMGWPAFGAAAGSGGAAPAPAANRLNWPAFGDNATNSQPAANGQPANRNLNWPAFGDAATNGQPAARNLNWPAFGDAGGSGNGSASASGSGSGASQPGTALNWPAFGDHSGASSGSNPPGGQQG
ncbi:leucine-rich repeat receptor kinase EMS1 [Chlorella sorokiniana]|uniref:non-specific serine/threonine protein kinase n=1 Tax=Chlorella sorokiniana TaxID=3076 RepID=A0A2P6U425_CHLSO|nr:leucine-rich repeat receptor kinase EMS1 [Chlorella sorokiniana]|eukprot:PRW61077.1 leucine-rich repeat receptor kinase EMS1 [Chlorella sorokiniana]